MEHPSHSPDRKIGINPSSLIIRQRMGPPRALVPERERCFVESHILLDRPTLAVLDGHETVSLKVRLKMCADKLD